MPMAPPPMSSYACLHDPIAHAKSEQEAKEVRTRRPRAARARRGADAPRATARLDAEVEVAGRGPGLPAARASRRQQCNQHCAAEIPMSARRPSPACRRTAEWLLRLSPFLWPACAACRVLRAG